jgi:polyisoprenoid-binding protein YceI
MVVHRVVYAIAGGILLFGSVVQGDAEEDELCGVFMDGKVDGSVVDGMLSAADDGHLYRIQSSTSRIGFCVDSELARVNGVFREFQGGLSLWPDPGEKELALVLIQVASLDTGGSLIENLLKGERFFDADKYPEILFVSKSVSWTSGTTAELKGDLTLHGVTKPVVFKVQVSAINRDDAGDRVEKVIARAGTVIRRSDFGMGTFPQLVDDKVELCMSVEAVRHKI